MFGQELSTQPMVTGHLHSEASSSTHDYSPSELRNERREEDLPCNELRAITFAKDKR